MLMYIYTKNEYSYKIVLLKDVIPEIIIINIANMKDTTREMKISQIY